MEWNCVNVLVDESDVFSKAGATALIKEAEKRFKKKTPPLNVCGKFKLGEIQKNAITDIIDEQCCELNVVFANYETYAKLLDEGYKATESREDLSFEWILGSNAGNGLGKIKEQLGTDTDDKLRGGYDFT